MATMDIRPEAAAAAAWWAAALETAGADAERVAVFERALAEGIEALCEDGAWQPDIPTYGSCGRQVTSSPRPDGALARAARAAGVSSPLDRLPPAVMWVNPGEVLVEAAGDHAPIQLWPPSAGDRNSRRLPKQSSR
jgi:BTG family